MEPECAEILLLAGRHSPLFPRIRCVIFDEVHNIVSKEGSVWEHLLTFINAPFVALSATVGNPIFSANTFYLPIHESQANENPRLQFAAFIVAERSEEKRG